MATGNNVSFVCTVQKIFPMTVTNTTGLRELAHRYYLGELSYEAYRNDRTRLLDSMTGQAGDDDASRENTQPMPDKTRLMEASSKRRYRPLWIFLAILVMIATLLWQMNKEWFLVSSMQRDAASPKPDNTLDNNRR